MYILFRPIYGIKLYTHVNNVRFPFGNTDILDGTKYYKAAITFFFFLTHISLASHCLAQNAASDQDLHLFAYSYFYSK